MNAVVGAFNQGVGAFSVIVKTGCGTDGSFYSTSVHTPPTVHCPGSRHHNGQQFTDLGGETTSACVLIGRGGAEQEFRSTLYISQCPEKAPTRAFSLLIAPAQV